MHDIYICVINIQVHPKEGRGSLFIFYYDFVVLIHNAHYFCGISMSHRIQRLPGFDKHAKTEEDGVVAI